MPTDITQEPEFSITSMQGERTAEKYDAVVDQFAVEQAERYAPRDLTGDGRNETFCNVFAADVCSAMGAPLPRLRANQMVSWLAGPGSDAGWAEVNSASARLFAAYGHPTLVAWQNPDPQQPGHIAVVRPSTLTSEPLRIAQAGARNFARGTLAAGFGSRPVRFFVHR